MTPRPTGKGSPRSSSPAARARGLAAAGQPAAAPHTVKHGSRAAKQASSPSKPSRLTSGARLPAAAPARTAAVVPPADDLIHRMLDGVRTAGLKLTPQRIAIVRSLAADPSHPTAQEIFDRLQSSMPTMSFATVYNTLDALASAGLCGSLSLAPGPARFDPNMAPHHHAVCDGCGLVRDVARPATAAGAGESARTLARIDAAPALSGFEVRAVEHIYRGLCAACSARDVRQSLPRDVRQSLPRDVRQSLPRDVRQSLPRERSPVTPSQRP